MKSMSQDTARKRSCSLAALKVLPIVEQRLEERFSAEQSQRQVLPIIPKKKENPIKVKEIERLRRKENKLIAYVI